MKTKTKFAIENGLETGLPGKKETKKKNSAKVKINPDKLVMCFCPSLNCWHHHHKYSLYYYNYYYYFKFNERIPTYIIIIHCLNSNTFFCWNVQRSIVCDSNQLFDYYPKLIFYITDLFLFSFVFLFFFYLLHCSHSRNTNLISHCRCSVENV